MNSAGLQKCHSLNFRKAECILLRLLVESLSPGRTVDKRCYRFYHWILQWLWFQADLQNGVISYSSFVLFFFVKVTWIYEQNFKKLKKLKIFSEKNQFPFLLSFHIPQRQPFLSLQWILLIYISRSLNNIFILLILDFKIWDTISWLFIIGSEDITIVPCTLTTLTHTHTHTHISCPLILPVFSECMIMTK